MGTPKFRIDRRRDKIVLVLDRFLQRVDRPTEKRYMLVNVVSAIARFIPSKLQLVQPRRYDGNKDVCHVYPFIRLTRHRVRPVHGLQQ